MILGVTYRWLRTRIATFKNSKLLKQKSLIELIYVSLLVIFYITILHSFFFNTEIYGWGTDIYGHLYKIWKVMNQGYVEWTKDWYAGSPLFRFYPPLSYLIATFFGKIFNSDIIGFKITVLLAMIIGAYGTRFLLKELEINEKIAYFTSILYPIHPFFLNNVIPEGNFPRFIALMFLPLFVLALLYIFRYKDIKRLALASLLISLIILTHHNTAFVAIFLILGLSPYFFLTRKILFKDVLKNTLIVGLLSLLLTSFWIIPFVFELKYSGFIDELKEESQYQMWSVDMKRILEIDFRYDYYFGVFFFILGVFGYLFDSFNKKIKDKVLNLNFLFIILLILILAWGYYGPFPQINLISPLSKVLPYRFLDNLGLLMIIGISKLLSTLQLITKGSIKMFASFFLLFIIIIDISLVIPKINIPYLSEWVKEQVFPEYLEILNFILTENIVFNENIHQCLTDINIGSTVSYYPSIYNISNLLGWYRQGILKFHKRIVSPIVSLHFKDIGDFFFGSTESSLITQNVKCIITRKWANTNYSNVVKNLELLGFKQIFENNHYSLWCWNKNSFITPKHYQLIREYKIGRLFALVGDSLIVKSLNIDYDHFKSLDDIANHENIFAYKVISLYDYRDYENASVWNKLEEFVRRGGILVIDTFRSKDMNSRIFNVSSYTIKIEKKNLYSEKYDITKFDEFSRDFDWYATVYSGDLRPIIKYKIKDNVRIEEYVAIGYKTIGYGYVIFLGLNLPHHIEYSGSDYEEFVLRDILGRFIPLFPDIIDYRILEYTDGRIRLVVNAKFDSWVVIAQSYFPEWRARLNGVEIPVYEDSIYGLIELYIPEGTWILELEFVDRWIWLKAISALGFVASIIILLREHAKKLWKTVQRIKGKLRFSVGHLKISAVYSTLKRIGEHRGSYKQPPGVV